MTETEVLRKEVEKYVERADDKSLRIVKAILEIEQEDNNDWWDELPENVQASIEHAIEDTEKGNGIPHEVIVEKYSQWFKR